MSEETIRDNVRKILSQHEQARNDDIFLILTYWKEINKAPINIEAILRTELTHTESIRRARQKIQNEEGLFPPTDSEVIERRASHK